MILWASRSKTFFFAPPPPHEESDFSKEKTFYKRSTNNSYKPAAYKVEAAQHTHSIHTTQNNTKTNQLN
jgi:hypothetical protein